MQLRRKSFSKGKRRAIEWFSGLGSCTMNAMKPLALPNSKQIMRRGLQQDFGQD